MPKYNNSFLAGMIFGIIATVITFLLIFMLTL
jgi:hypothetical protein